MDTKEVITKYLRAYKSGDQKGVRGLLADKGEFGHGSLSPDEVVREMFRTPVWDGVKVVSEVYSDSGDAAIMYEGVDTATGQPLRSAEFLRVADGRIQRLNALIIGGANLGGRRDVTSFVATDAI